MLEMRMHTSWGTMQADNRGLRGLSWLHVDIAIVDLIELGVLPSGEIEHGSHDGNGGLCRRGEETASGGTRSMNLYPALSIHCSDIPKLRTSLHSFTCDRQTRPTAWNQTQVSIQTGRRRSLEAAMSDSPLGSSSYQSTKQGTIAEISGRLLYTDERFAE